MKIGFTGTRFGMTELQLHNLERILSERSSVELHHGDCEGADKEAHYLTIAVGGFVHIHPPVDDKHRAFCKGSVMMFPEKTHFARNRDIVHASEVLIATPYNDFEESKGGTWYTVDYARKIDKPVIILWPTRGVTYEGLSL